MKKILIVIMVIDILLLMCYCGIHNTNDTPSQSEGATTSSSASTSTAEVTDQPIVTTSATTVGKDTTADQKPEEEASGHFASYESILKLCRIATESFDYVNENPRGLASELFGFGDSTEKDWFLHIYYALGDYLSSNHDLPNYKLVLGYAVKDLNGDGINELVLINDTYIVGAIFSMVNGKPILLDSYIPRGSCWIDANGQLHFNGSGGASYLENIVYKVAIGGASLDVIAGFGMNGFEWIGDEAVTIYYKLVNGEKVRITEAEHGALEEQYGEYLGYRAGAAATKEQAGLAFMPLFEDANDPQEMLKAALNNEIKVYRKVSIYPTEYELLYLKDYYIADVGMSLGEFDERAGCEYARMDLDGDSCKELVINSYGIVILRYYCGSVYMYPFTVRQMHHLYTDGSFPAHSQEDGYLNVSEYQLYFEVDDFKQKELCRTVTKDESHFEYYIDGKQVTEEEMEYYQKKHPKARIEFTPEVVWDEDPVSFLSQDVKNTWKEDLITLLSQLDIWEPENSIPGSHAVGLMDLNFDNTPEVLVAYPGGSMGNVWVEIYDLKSHDEPIICYNAMGYQNAVFLYVAKVGAQYVTIAEGSIRDPEAGWCYCIESLSSEINTGNLYLKTENLFAIADKINVDGYGPYYYMGESVDKSKFDEEYQTFRNTYEVIRPTEMQMVMWSEFDLSNQEKAAREMANALVNTSQQFIDYKN